jgi:carbamoyltransferase
MVNAMQIKRVLGITMGACSSAALFVDGKIVACVSEERLVRKKNYDGYPKGAVELCLEYGKVSPESLDFIALASERVDPDYIITRQGSNRNVSDWVKEMHEYWYPIFYGRGKRRTYIDIFRDKMDFEQYPGNFDSFPFGTPDRIRLFKEFRMDIIVNHLKVSREKVLITEHHLSHALYALLAGPERRSEVLVFTADGFGDHSNASIRRRKNGEFTLEYETDICNIGRLYRCITLLLGMKPGEHEYKVMGLAAYAHPRIYREVLDILKDTLYLDAVEFKYKTKPTDHYFWFQKKFEGQRFDVIAGGVQKYIECLLSDWVRNSIDKYNICNVAFSGGVSMNIKANQEILKLPEVSHLSVPGSGGDESLAIGSIYALLFDKGYDIEDIEPLRDLYLGSYVTKEEINEFIKINDLHEKYKITHSVTPRDIAELLVNDEIIARFAGRMEFGQRALGNRSILADPSNRENVKIINDIVKQRDFWMPFAPTILYEDADRYLHNPKGVYSPFMTIGYDTKLAAHTDLIAALHPADLTARPQILKSETNEDYYEIIKEFKKLTGIGGLLNTSFNLHGLPIVESLSDALHVMENSKIKYLLLEDILLQKNSEV